MEVRGGGGVKSIADVKPDDTCTLYKAHVYSCKVAHAQFFRMCEKYDIVRGKKAGE